jgi:hypothetical protein
MIINTLYALMYKSRDSSVGIALGYGWTIGVLGFDSRRGLGIVLFTTASRMALEPTQPPIQWVPGALSVGVKRPGREADHIPPLPNMPSWRGAQLKHRDNLCIDVQ